MSESELANRAKSMSLGCIETHETWKIRALFELRQISHRIKNSGRKFENYDFLVFFLSF